MVKRSARITLGLVMLCLLVTACHAQPQGQESIQTASILDLAAAEATAIVQRAEATALMLQAQAKATAVMAKAIAAEHTPTPAPTRVVQIVRKDQTTDTPTPTPRPGLEDDQPESQELAVEVVRVSFSAEGAMIHIQFRAPPDVATKWWQGSVSVTDEATGTTFNEIPVMPRIGPLIGRPLREGQLGYVMLMHTPPVLKPGSVVTVVLGTYEFQHIGVQ